MKTESGQDLGSPISLFHWLIPKVAMRFAIRRELVPGLQLKSVLHYTVLNIPKRYVLQAITFRCHVFEKTKIMASCPITSIANKWGNSRNSGWLYFWGAPKSLQMVTVAMKLRHFLLGRKVMTNLDSILKSRDITLPTKVHLAIAMVFPVVMYGCESWTIRKAEHWRIDAFELWCWRRLLRVPWAARRSNQSILKEISPGCLLAGLMLKLKLQYFGHLMRRADSLEKNPDAGKDWGQEEKGKTEDEMAGWHHWLDGHELG